jgi:hypothetical protein
VLAVSDGTNAASLTFVGFTGTFKFASDGSGGTDIFDPPANSTNSSVSLGHYNFIFHPNSGANTGNSDNQGNSGAHDHFAWTAGRRLVGADRRRCSQRRASRFRAPHRRRRALASRRAERRPPALTVSA